MPCSQAMSVHTFFTSVRRHMDRAFVAGVLTCALPFYYAMPFFFVIWVVTLAELLPHLHRLVGWSVDQILHLPRPSPARTWLNRAAFATILILVLGSNIGFPRGLRLVVSDTP